MTDVRTLVEGVLRLDPGAEAIEFERRWWSWGDLAARIASLTALYDSIGLGQGARIGVMLRNRPPHFAALFSAVASGRCLVTLNPVYPDAVLAGDIAGLDLPVIVGDRHDLDREGIMDAASARGTAVIALPEPWAGDAELIAPRGRDPSTRVASDGVIIEMLTSGTTGKPKRVALTANAFQHSFDAALAYESGRDEFVPRLRSGTQILAAPLTHIGGIWGAINAVAAGRKLVLLERFRVVEWHDAVVRHRPRVAGVTSAGLRMILDAGVPRDDLSSILVLTSGAAPVDPAVIDAFHDRYGIPVLSNYGATEFAGPVAGWSLSEFKTHFATKRGSAGKLHRGVEARIVDPESGAVLEPGGEGVLELRSKQLADPANWLRTTDRAVLDVDDFLYIRGRADAAIIRGGFKVQPDDVVRALEAHPAVREAVVVAIADARLGQVPAAAVIPKAGVAPPEPAALEAYLRERLLPYQVPTVIRIVDDVPRTASMKPVLPEVARMLGAD